MADWSPGENLIVRRLPCVACGATPARYIERRLCRTCYRHQGKGKIPKPQQFQLWTASRENCLVWLGSISPEGYGRFGRTYAHRWSYEHFIGPIPDGLEIDHLCRNRWCVEPEHLDPVTSRVNTLRAVAKYICPYGHQRMPGKGCRECKRDHMRRYTARRKAEGWKRTAAGWIRNEVTS